MTTQQTTSPLSAQDIAQFESLNFGSEQQQSTPATSSQQQSTTAAAPSTTQPSRNPYNPFLTGNEQTSGDSGLYQLPTGPPPAQQSSSGAATYDPPSGPPPPLGQANSGTGLYQPPPGPPPPNSTSANPFASATAPSVATEPLSQFPAPTQPSQAAAGGSTLPASTEPKSWPTKDVLFQGQERKITMQNENGPCGLIAIANILLLRGQISLQPPDRPLVSYEYISSLIAEYLLTRPQQPDPQALEEALSMLPSTQHGLNLNPSFLSNEEFYSSGSQSQHLALFDLLGIKLYHGFLPDQSFPEGYELVTQAGSYDAAVDQVVKGDEVAARFFTEAMGDTSIAAPLKELKQRGGVVALQSKGWGSSQDHKIVSDALEIANFLDANASQLTYPGLFALSTLPEGTMAALFRFNHLSVFYRPTDQDHSSSGEHNPGSALLTLITDEAFLGEDFAVWESLADVDGSGSGEIFDGRFRKRQIDQSARRARDLGGYGTSGATGNANEDADYALALQLHSEESDRVEERRQRQEQRRRARDSRQGNAPPPQPVAFNQQQNTKRQSGILSSLGVGRKKQQQPPSARYGSAGSSGPYAPPEGPPPSFGDDEQQQGGSSSANAGEYAPPAGEPPFASDTDAQTPQGEQAAAPRPDGRKKDKKDCVIM